MNLRCFSVFSSVFSETWLCGHCYDNEAERPIVLLRLPSARPELSVHQPVRIPSNPSVHVQGVQSTLCKSRGWRWVWAGQQRWLHHEFSSWNGTSSKYSFLTFETDWICLLLLHVNSLRQTESFSFCYMWTVWDRLNLSPSATCERFETDWIFLLLLHINSLRQT